MAPEEELAPPRFCSRFSRHLGSVWVALQWLGHSTHCATGTSHTKQKQFSQCCDSAPGRHGHCAQFSRA